ncbi:MAG: hypothetical protein A3A08_00520 [Candidatus Nealsonbacteria bacterium RIFCSPLOWO2_01_FULL_41_9]|uniref:Uncharacterized protein n=1 Tax=Candidatus Nealsonbacteria bacterium RIFCSPLOWO2_01_FULL_41_9 TaxID=1801671 RepID=A0A1G2EE64_9BACT|nr:MAG: hypothetical protein A3A08_00520 [Candidatus Nealsonbacteria bacterium RIFCSPLOWO2_01_FULL_41_9]
MEDKKQGANPAAPKGPERIGQVQGIIRSLPGKNELFSKYNIREKRAEEIATSLKQFDRDLDPKDKLELKKSLEKTMREDRDSAKRREAEGLLKFYRDHKVIDP